MAKTRVPSRVTWVIGVASAVIAGLVNIEAAAELTSIGILLAFVVVCAAVVDVGPAPREAPPAVVAFEAVSVVPVVMGCSGKPGTAWNTVT